MQVVNAYVSKDQEDNIIIVSADHIKAGEEVRSATHSEQICTPLASFRNDRTAIIIVATDHIEAGEEVRSLNNNRMKCSH